MWIAWIGNWNKNIERKNQDLLRTLSTWLWSNYSSWLVNIKCSFTLKSYHLLKILQSLLNKITKILKNEAPQVSVGFDIDPSPAVRYFQDPEHINFSLYGIDTIIPESKKNGLVDILKAWIRAGKSYTQIAKEISLFDSVLFPRPIALDISITELWQAYGWANYQSGIDMAKKYTMVKSWQTCKDSGVCAKCLANETAGDVPFNEPFPGTGDHFAPSKKEIWCRCTSTYQIVGIK